MTVPPPSVSPLSAVPQAVSDAALTAARAAAVLSAGGGARKFSISQIWKIIFISVPHG